MASIPSQAYLNEDRRSALLVTSISTITFSGLFFVARMTSRLMKGSSKQRSFDASDYTLLAGLISAWTLSALAIYDTTQGLARHLEAIAMTDPALGGPTRLMQSAMAVECLYPVSLGCIKVSFLLLFRKVFPGKKFRRITEIVGIAVIVVTTVFCFLAIFACRPVKAFWDFTPSPETKCMSLEVMMIAGGAQNITTDLVVLCLPQTVIWKLQMDRKSKIALAFTLLLGGCTIIASIIRFTVLFHLDMKDLTWSLVNVGIWNQIELATAVASASMTCMRPLMRIVFRKSLHSKDLGSANGASKNNKELLPLSSRPASCGDTDNFQRLEDGPHVEREQHDGVHRGKTPQVAVRPVPDDISITKTSTTTVTSRDEHRFDY